MTFNKDEMLIMPAVDIKDGKCVQLVQGDPGTEIVNIENPEKVALKWEEMGAEALHLIDLDGTLNWNVSLDTLKKVVDNVSIPVQIGGGIRKVDYAKKLLDMDVERVIIGTMGIMHPDSLTILSDEYGSDRIMVSLDSKNDKIVVKGWKQSIDSSPQELSQSMKKYGAGSILFTNVDVEGLMGGFNLDPLIKLKDSIDLPIVYSGGISTIADVKKLNKIGVEGIVIGSALYKNKIDLKEALNYQKKIE